MNGAMVSNNQLYLWGSQNQFMSVGKVTTGNNGLTFASWFRSDNSGSYARIFDFGNGPNADNIYMSLYGTSNELFVSILTGGNQGGSYFPWTANVNNNVWYHAVWVLNPTGEWTVYVNGEVVIQATGAKYPDPVARTSNYLGQSNYGHDAHFNGAIRDFRMYDRVLSAAEVQLLFTTTQVGSHLAVVCNLNMKTANITVDAHYITIAISYQRTIGLSHNSSVCSFINTTLHSQNGQSFRDPFY